MSCTPASVFCLSKFLWHFLTHLWLFPITKLKNLSIVNIVLAEYCGKQFRNLESLGQYKTEVVWLFHVTPGYCHQEAVHLPPCCLCGLASSLLTLSSHILLNQGSLLTWWRIFTFFFLAFQMFSWIISVLILFSLWLKICL